MKKRPNGVLSNYPLTQAFKLKLAGIVGQDAVWLTMGELRQSSVPGMMRRLRTINFDSLFLPVEDDEGRALLPILQLLAGIAPAKRRATIDQSLRQTPFRRIGLLRSAWNLAAASLASIASLLQTAREVEALVSSPRIAPPSAATRSVMFLNSNLWFGVKAGGSVGHISGVVNGFLDLGWPVAYAAVGGRLLIRPEAEHIQLNGPRNFGLPAEYNYYRFHQDVIRQAGALSAAREAAFIYQRMSVCNFSGVVLSRRLNKPLVLEYNGSEAWVAKNWGRGLRSQRLAERCEEVAMRHAHLVVTISDVLRDELLARGVSAERIVSYPNCIDPETFEPDRFPTEARMALRARHAIPKDAIVVTFVGTFGQWHGAPVLAQAARVLLEQQPGSVWANKLHFLFVGDGVRMPEVKTALGPMLDSPQVTLAGLVPQNEAPSYLAASDILSSPHVPNADGSRFFGSPTKLFEYMAMGKAIIASDLDQIGQVLSGSIHARDLSDSIVSAGAAPAVLTVPGSVEELVKSIAVLAQQSSLRNELGANARARALNRYTWRRHVAAILEGARSVGIAGGIGG